MVLKHWKLFCVLLVHVYVLVTVADNVKQLPHCVENSVQGLVLISTLDGKLSALTTNGELLWEIPTDPGPLLQSNIHNVELTNNGEWSRIIPSLSGSLYKFNGKTVDAIPISADNLLKSSFVYSSDLVIAGGKEVRTYGVGLHTGHVLYTCSLHGCQNKTQYDGEIDDVIIIERNMHTIRAHEPRTGSERWNFSVGHHNVMIPNQGCLNLSPTVIDFNLTAILPEGLIEACKKGDKSQVLWSFKFDTPIVKVWLWDGKDLRNIDTFESASIVENNVKLSPAIYLAMYNKQLYIHESDRMLKTLQHNRYSDSDSEVLESRSITTFPWKPVDASSTALRQSKDQDHTTALSVLYNSEYVNGNGFFLYTTSEPQNIYIATENTTDGSDHEETMFLFWPFQWHWSVHLTVVVAICLAYLLCNFVSFEFKASHSGNSLPSLNTSKSSETTVTEVPPETPTFTSHYETSFDTIGCLGKGGFGVVFEAKQKIDQCGYAIKRISLRNEDTPDHVLREVRALATLDHKNIVRYFNSWFERPPPGYQYEHDKNWAHDSTSYIQSTTPIKSHRRNNSTIIDLSEVCNNCTVTESSGGIVFQNDATGIELQDVTETESQSSVSKKKKISLCESVKGTLSKTVNTETATRNTTTRDGEASANVTCVDRPVFLYIQMQLCRQESLKEWLFENDKNRNLVAIYGIFRQILDAVEYVHSKGLIHRDLKPSNIFFSMDGDIKVGDFGLVTTMNEEYDETVNVHNSIQNNHTKGVGTRLYMSPEQIKKQKYNYKVDIYSLGVILFELLVPFSTESERVNTLTNLRAGVYPSSFAENHKEEYALLGRMLANEPHERPNTGDIKETSLFS